MEDLSQRKPPQLAIKAEDTTPAGENGALVWSTQEGRLITYNENAGRWGVPSMLPAFSSIRLQSSTNFSFVDIVSIGATTLNANTQYFFPFYLPNTQSFSSLRYQVTTAASSGYAQVGIYNTLKSGSWVRPNQLIVGTSNMNITSVGMKSATVTSTTLYAGVIYWASILVTANVGLVSASTITRLFFNTSLSSPIVLLETYNGSGNLFTTMSSSPGFSNIQVVPLLAYT
jgi:hypothetical protein